MPGTPGWMFAVAAAMQRWKACCSASCLAVGGPNEGSRVPAGRWALQASTACCRSRVFDLAAGVSPPWALTHDWKAANERVGTAT